MTKPSPEIQSTAELIYRWVRSLPTPRDGAAALALAHAAMIWTQRPKDEAAVRLLMGQMTEVIVSMWKAQVEAAKVKGTVA